MSLSLWVQSEKAEVYCLWWQRKMTLSARFSCPGNMFSTRSFISLRQQSDSKGRYLHNIYISLIYATLYHWNQSQWAFSKELVAFPSALHTKLSANQESTQNTQQTSFSTPTSAQHGFFGQTLFCGAHRAQAVTVQPPHALCEVLSCPYF